MRTTWIRTIEKLLILFRITYTEESITFKTTAKKSVDQKYLRMWEHDFYHLNHSRLEFYKTIKRTFGYEGYLEMTNFEWRKGIAKIRCSSHTLAIEKGRHNNKLRDERVCSVCNLNEVETEDHFLTKCPIYHLLRRNYNMNGFISSIELFKHTPPILLGQFIGEASKLRKAAIYLTGSTR